jgi:lipopolysaccharide/colanic/teichoic acid biosynthesis glycosyltransferase
MKSRNFHLWILVADLVWVPAAMVLAWLLHYGTAWNGMHDKDIQATIPFLVATWFLWNLLSSGMKLDGFRGGWRFSAVVVELFLALCGQMAALLAGAYLARQYISRLTLAYFGILLFVGFVAIRYSAHLLLRARYRNGNVRKAVIVGHGRVAREIALKVQRHPEMLCKVVGFLFPQDAASDQSFDVTSTSPPRMVSTLGVIDLLRAQGVNELILALARPAMPEVLNLVGRCRDLGINVSLVPQPYELYLSKPKLFDLDGLPLLQLEEAPGTAIFPWKRVVDLLLGLLLTLLAVPILLPTALALRWRKGRAFRRETRCGQHGKPFSMLRLNVDRRAIGAPRFERLLEKLSVTEVPQLWNVLRGDMSLVGPRPESSDRVRRYSEWQQQRLSVKPGMTGLAQVHGLREQHSSEEKTRFDLQYLLHPSPLRDLSLLLQTLWTLAARLIRYSRLGVAESGIAEQELSNVFNPHFIQETLHSAHRSQPSAD